MRVEVLQPEQNPLPGGLFIQEEINTLIENSGYSLDFLAHVPE